MSLFSYIAFPRPVDTSCIESKFDESKSYTIGDIRGTELEEQWEKQFGGSLEGLPDNLSVYFGDWWSDFHGISIHDKHEDFNNIFTNRFIYGFEGEFQLLDEERVMEGYRERQGCFPENEESAETLDHLNKMIKSNKENVAICKKQLYDVVMLNINPNESVEIYSDWADNRNIFDFDSPEKEIVIDAESVSSSELIDMQPGTKIVITRRY